MVQHFHRRRDLFLCALAELHLLQPRLHVRHREIRVATGVRVGAKTVREREELLRSRHRTKRAPRNLKKCGKSAERLKCSRCDGQAKGVADIGIDLQRAPVCFRLANEAQSITFAPWHAGSDVGSRWNDVFLYSQFDLTGPNRHHSSMRRFEVLFDRAEPNTITAPPFDIYGPLGFPEPPPDRPWVYTNFVQSLDGVASLRGKYASGGHISQSEEDRWLMDLLRAHADALMIGMGTLVEEKALGTPGN